MVATVAVTWVLAAVAVLWVIRLAVEVSGWYWRREVERVPPSPVGPRSHVRPMTPPFDWGSHDEV